MGIEDAKFVPCHNCDRSDLMDIDLLNHEAIPPQYLDPERDKEGDLFCPTCRVKLVSIDKAQSDPTYQHYGFDFKFRDERLAAREKRIEENDPVSYRMTQARRRMARAQRGY